MFLGYGNKGEGKMPLIDVNGTQINYLDEGPRDAPAIIFSNSMFFDVTMFELSLIHI